MLCYFISKKNLSILNCTKANSNIIEKNLDCGGKTKIVIAESPNASNGDYVVLKEGKEFKFKGIIESIDNIQGEKKHTITCLEIERMFDQKIFLSDTEIIKEAGLEDFIAATIKKYFASTGDNITDLPYVNCTVLTHTKVSSKPSADDGVYNLKTYIGNIKEQYGIFLDFEFTKTKLNISIYKKEQSPMQIDTTLTDVNSCKETYEIKALAKLNVKWLNTTTQEESMRYFYLHSDRTVSEVNEDRVDGTVSSLYVAIETEEEMREAVTKEFQSNSYSHLIEADIFTNSKIYPMDELYVGHQVLLKTDAGVKSSIISKITHSDGSDVVSINFGNLKVTLTDKLTRKEQ